MTWKTIIIKNNSGLDSEEIGYLLLEAGAESAFTENQPDVITCYVETLKHDKIIEECKKLNLEIQKIEDLKPENWSQLCPELNQEIELKSFSVIPVRDTEDDKIKDDHNLYIIPGSGFGTGHHPTTLRLLNILEELSEKKVEIKNTLDFGTGSGILAIATAKLFNSKVLGVDNNQLALDNALDNIKINKLNALITLTNNAEIIYAQKYNLIIANIYGEILLELIPQFSKILERDSFLILSGINNDNNQRVLECIKNNYKNSNISSYQDDGWFSYLIS